MKGSKKNTLKRIDTNAAKKITITYDRNSLPKLLLDFAVEDSFYMSGYELVAGVDEVGRGALAGPIVAAAVILKRNNIFIEGINDSKKINAKKRKELFKNNNQ